MEMEEACHGCTKVRPDSEVANAIPPVRSIGGGDKTRRQEPAWTPPTVSQTNRERRTDATQGRKPVTLSLLSQLDRQNMAADQHCGPIALIQISHNATIIQTIRKVV